jgi:hypothetical protein
MPDWSRDGTSINARQQQLLVRARSDWPGRNPLGFWKGSGAGLMILRMRRLPYRCEFSGRRGVDRESGRAGAEAGDGGGLIRVESCGAATGDGEWGLPFPGRSGFPCARARRRACCHAQLRMLLQRWVGVGLCFAVRRGKARQAGRAITESRTRINPLPCQHNKVADPVREPPRCRQVVASRPSGRDCWAVLFGPNPRPTQSAGASIVKIRRYGVQVVI